MNTSSSSPDEALKCHLCGEDRPFILWCASCGDRIEGTAGLSPYERLHLKPQSLYHQSEVRAAEERVLHKVHSLKSSRQRASWSLRQRALIRRDAKLLCTLSGALASYLKFCLTRLEERSELVDWGMPLAHTLDMFSVRDEAEGQVSSASTLDLFLLDLAYQEVDEYDGYQERERLLNHFTRELLTRASGLASELNINQDNPQALKMVAVNILALQRFEAWLDQYRQSTV